MRECNSNFNKERRGEYNFLKFVLFHATQVLQVGSNSLVMKRNTHPLRSWLPIQPILGDPKFEVSLR